MMQTGMTSRLVVLCFDANDPLRLARFWAAALGWKIDGETGDEIGLVPTDNTRFQIEFSAVPEQTREVGYFWSEALGWPLVWDQDEETAIRAPDGTGPFITWGPPLAPKIGKNRLHLDIAPPNHVDQRAEVDRLVALGATRIDIGQGEVDWVVMADPDGNEFCVLSPR